MHLFWLWHRSCVRNSHSQLLEIHGAVGKSVISHLVAISVCASEAPGRAMDNTILTERETESRIVEEEEKIKKLETERERLWKKNAEIVMQVLKRRNIQLFNTTAGSSGKVARKKSSRK
eukprot:scpid106792/ scgid12713/ 